MTFGWARFVLPTLLSVVAIATTAGCAGTVVAEYAVKAQISGRYETGHVWRASTDELSYPSLPPGILVAFPPTLYAGKLFEWSFTPSAYAFSGRIKNRIESPICFRFDQAELRSNFQINAIPMRVYTAMQRVSGRIETMVRLGSNNPTIRRRYIHPGYCFQPGQDVIFSFWPDLAELFPTQKMFNVSWSEGGELSPAPG